MYSEPLLLTIPGGIRNQIFDLCVQQAMVPRKIGRGSVLNGFPTPDIRSITVSVLPRWSGLGVIRTQGIAGLPLVFVNKQIHSELLSIVYSKADCVSIGAYIVQRADEDPSVRWDVAHSLLMKRPSLMKFTKKVKIHMPRLREDLYRSYFMSTFHKTPQISAVYNRWAILPALKEFLLNFQQLASLEVVVYVDEKQTPNFDNLLPIYDLCGKKTVVEFEFPPPEYTNPVLRSTWSFAWEQALRKSERL